MLQQGLNIIAKESGNGYLFLRFTEDPQADMQHGFSRWYVEDMELELAIEKGESLESDQFGTYRKHAGLCGHDLETEDLEDAIQDINKGWEPRSGWFRDIETSNYAIYEGYETSIQDTPEGTTFRAEKLVAFVVNDVESFNNWRDNYSECLTEESMGKI